MGHTLLFLLSVFILWSCADNDVNTHPNAAQGKPYDPSQPTVISSFTPSEGKIREKVVIEGSNFGNDTSRVRVYFYDGTKNRKATIIHMTDNAIFCLAPRQNAGKENKIKVAIDGGEPVVAEQPFAYEAVEAVSTILSEVTNGKEEGKLSEVSFDYANGVGYIGDEALIVSESSNESQRIRYVSIQDNNSFILQKGIVGGKPAVSKDYSKAYIATQKPPYTIYMYSRDAGWMPSRLGEIGTLPSDDQTENFINALVIAEDESKLYFCSTKGQFGYFDINTKKSVILNEHMNISTSYQTMMTGGYHAMERTNYMVYSPVEKCFYISVAPAFTIYKSTLEGEASEFCGKINVTRAEDGDISDATFVMPHGMAIDADGNIYVTDGSRSGGHFIRKINIETRYVSTVAGRAVSGLPDRNSVTDGVTPLDAVLRLPTDICFDGGGGFYFTDGWGRRLRKYAIE